MNSNGINEEKERLGNLKELHIQQMEFLFTQIDELDKYNPTEQLAFITKYKKHLSYCVDMLKEEKHSTLVNLKEKYEKQLYKLKEIEDKLETTTNSDTISQNRKKAENIIKSVKPNKAIINNSLAENKLIDIEKASDNGTDVTVRVDKGANGAIKVVASLNYESNQIELIGKPLTPFDKTVHNAICTLYEAGNKNFTLEMVYRAIHGLTNSERITEIRGTLNPIRESIETGIYKKLKINAEEQIKKHYPSVKKVIYESYFLPLEKITAIMHNGEEPIECYKFLKAPPLYEYSKNIKQVISVPIGLLDSRKTIKNSPDVAVIREYLIKRISTLKNDKTTLKNCNIKYSTIFSETGINEANLQQTQRNRKREQIKKILEHFIKQGFIKEYSEYKKGRIFEGVTIYF